MSTPLLLVSIVRTLSFEIGISVSTPNFPLRHFFILVSMPKLPFPNSNLSSLYLVRSEPQPRANPTSALEATVALPL